MAGRVTWEKTRRTHLSERGVRCQATFPLCDLHLNDLGKEKRENRSRRKGGVRFTVRRIPMKNQKGRSRCKGG
ncbi:hypothetical protein POVCU2_0075150 [Plasmodium ovale curtisi]|uniref:Uncharacterized protein n=1 Tax=Plasmodium ovale curtisi TaxID=864141 RepID=A0A1A8WMR5_PLAOA|nr:hypothetical protein POVCU1_001710 [Plasmodium ovale curtisi]SBS92607.1 hypothetical protein POVCU2_0075150 [Plasmodium ovale curtisi]